VKSSTSNVQRIKATRRFEGELGGLSQDLATQLVVCGPATLASLGSELKMQKLISTSDIQYLNSQL
jgi:hypothetical protein